MSDFLADSQSATPPSSPSRRWELLRELVMVDLEYRWKIDAMTLVDTLPLPGLQASHAHASLPLKPQIEDYVQAYPELATTNSLLPLIVHEYLVRTRWGDRPSQAEYLRRFPTQERQLADELARIDEELLAEASHLSATSDHCPQEQTPDGTGPSLTVGTGTSPTMPASIGRYEILSRIGSGGFGAVFRAFDPLLKRDVALKQFHVADDEEPENLARLDHPGIVQVFDVGRSGDGVAFVVSRLVTGTNLAERIKAGRCTPVQAAELVSQVAEALQHAHDRGLIHRDIKPANILLDAAGRPLLADFGLALKEEDDARAIGLKGSPAYMSPEQARQQGEIIDARSDIFSLGVVLYELLAGARPFPSSNLAKLLDEIVNKHPSPPRTIDPSVPEELNRICQKCLSKDPAERYQSASALVRELQAFLTAKPAVGRRKFGTWITGAAVAVVVIPLAMAFWNTQPERATIPTANRVDVYVNDPKDVTRRGFLRDNPTIAPLRNGDQIRLEARTARPSYIYLIWIDSHGVPQPVFPWNVVGDWDSFPKEQRLVSHIALPDEADRGWAVTGDSGRETMLMMTRDEPIERSEEIELLLRDLPNQRASSGSVLSFLNGTIVGGNEQAGSNHDTRGLDTTAVRLDDAAFHTQALLKSRLEGLFQTTTALSIPHGP